MDEVRMSREHGRAPSPSCTEQLWDPSARVETQGPRAHRARESQSREGPPAQLWYVPFKKENLAKEEEGASWG